MCMPKAPKEDPEIKRQQAAQRRLEMERLAEEKKKDLVAQKKGIRGPGIRSLLAPDNPGAGYGSNA